MVTLSTALSVGGNYGHTSVWWVVLLSHKVCFIAIQRKIKHSLVANSILWLENISHCGTLWNIEHTFIPLNLGSIIH